MKNKTLNDYQGSFENLRGRYDTYKVLLEQIKEIKYQLENE